MNIITCPTGLFGVNTYLISKEGSKECIVIDLGENVDRIKRVIKDNDLIPKHVLLTHGHFDHISSLNEFRELYDIDVYAHELCSKALTDSNLNVSAHSMISRKEIICKEAENILSDGEQFSLCGLDIKAIHAPGHSLGSMVYIIYDNAFTGDVIFRMSIGRTDFVGGDTDVMMQTLAKLKNALSNNTKIYPGHGESSTMEFELENNPYLR